MNIVLLGSGNVASVLGRKIKAAGHDIVQVYSRNAHTASQLAYELDSESANYKSILNKDADLYMICVPDQAIPVVIDDLHLPGKIIVHTAASVPMDVLQSVSEFYGIFYPLQSLRKEINLLPGTPIFFEGNKDRVVKTLEALAEDISPGQHMKAGLENRVKLHVGAVLVSNFTNHLYALAQEYCEKEGLNFSLLLPLITETALRLEHSKPALLQTGPAIRGDEETITKHLELLNNYPHVKKIYELLTNSIKEFKN